MADLKYCYAQWQCYKSGFIGPIEVLVSFPVKMSCKSVSTCCAQVVWLCHDLEQNCLITMCEEVGRRRILTWSLPQLETLYQICVPNSITAFTWMVRSSISHVQTCGVQQACSENSTDRYVSTCRGSFSLWASALEQWDWSARQIQEMGKGILGGGISSVAHALQARSHHACWYHRYLWKQCRVEKHKESTGFGKPWLQTIKVIIITVFMAVWHRL